MEECSIPEHSTIADQVVPPKLPREVSMVLQSGQDGLVEMSFYLRFATPVVRSPHFTPGNPDGDDAVPRRRGL